MWYGVHIWIFTLLLSVVFAVLHPPGFNIFRRHRLTPPKPRSDAGEITEDWFDQKLDHNDPTLTTTWKQRYQMNPNYYSQGGPIFLTISGEGEAYDYWVQGGFMMDLVAEHGGLAFQLEHRFYGQSHPTEDLSLSNLQYLSTEQGAADIAYFIQSMKNQYQGKWIVFGGSYAGGLAALMRIKYPDLVQGAVVSSAPMNVTTGFPGYYETVGAQMKRSNPPCYEEVKNATQQIHDLLQSQEGAEKVSQLFNLCEPLDISKVNDVYTLKGGYSPQFAGAVQYDTYDASDTGALCSKLLDTANGATLLERFVNLGKQDYCGGVSFDGYTYVYGDITWSSNSNGRAWLYQTCTEYGDFQTTVSPNQPFIDGVPASYAVDLCILIFGESFNRDRVDQGVAKTNALLGNRHPNVSNVVFTQGTSDPWHLLGILEDLSPSAPVIIIENSTHTKDLGSPSEDDPPQMQAAHERIRNLVNEWLQQ